MLTDGQCDQHATIGVIFQRAQHAVPQRHARTVNLVHEARRIFRQLLVYTLDANVPGRTNVAFQRPGFEIKAVWIHGPVRTL